MYLTTYYHVDLNGTNYVVGEETRISNISETHYH